MKKGVPSRCDPPSRSPLLDGWTEPQQEAATTTESPIVYDDGIVIPSSGLLCGEVATTIPPDVDERACQIYTINALDNTRDAVIEIIDCILQQTETYTLPPNTCLFLYSLLQPLVIDPGFGSTDQVGGGSGDGSDDGDDGDDDDTYENENGSVAEDTDGDGIPDVGVVVDAPLDCTVLEPVPEEAPDGGDTEDGGSGDSSDAGTDGGVTGQPSPSGATGGIVYEGPAASGLACGGGDYDPTIQLVTSGNWLRVASVGHGTTQDAPVYLADGTQAPYTYKPNAMFIYERDADSTLVYSTYVSDKEIPTIYDGDNNYTYQKHRELAFQTPKQLGTQATIASNSPNDLVLIMDNYKNRNVRGNPGYLVLESTSPTNDGLTTPYYTFILSNGYTFGDRDVSYNSSGIVVMGTPESIENPDQRTFRYTLNGLDFRYDNFRGLNKTLPRTRAITIDGGNIFSPEFFSWNVNSGVTSGYGWDSGTYRVRSQSDWISETHTVYEHKLIPVEIDKNSYTVENNDLIASEDGWFPRDTSDSEDGDRLEFNNGVLVGLESIGVDIDNIFLEVVTATSYTSNPQGVRPDGTNMIRGSGPSDERPFPLHLSTQQTKRGLFSFGPSGNFFDLLRYDNASIIKSQPSSNYKYYRYEIHAEASAIPCFTAECNDTLRNEQEVVLNYWNTDLSTIDIVYPSGSLIAELATASNNCAPCSDVLECCDPFAVSEKSAYDNYQSFVVQGSGYVPINFYPCTISDKIATMRAVTANNPAPELPDDGDGDNVVVTTTTSDPSYDPPALSLSGNLFGNVPPCLTKYESSLDATGGCSIDDGGKFVYSHRTPSQGQGISDDYTMVIFFLGQWSLIQFTECLVQGNYTVFSTTSDVNPDNPNAPPNSATWTNSYQVEFNTEAC